MLYIEHVPVASTHFGESAKWSTSNCIPYKLQSNAEHNTFTLGSSIDQKRMDCFDKMILQTSFIYWKKCTCNTHIIDIVHAVCNTVFINKIWNVFYYMFSGNL